MRSGESSTLNFAARVLLVMIFLPSSAWSQSQIADQSNAVESALQVPTPQTNSGSAPPSESGSTVTPDTSSRAK